MAWRAWIDLCFGTAYVGGSASPFIDEGDGFTSERERVRMLLSLVTHADGYEIMVGAHNTVDATVECQMHMGGYVVFVRVWQMSAPATLSMPRGMWGALPYGSLTAPTIL